MPATDRHVEHRIGAIVLAAGTSTRMGRCKALLPFGDRPMIRRIVDAIFSARDISPVIIVTGFQPQPILDALNKTPIETIHNSNYQRGMISSVQAGVNAIRGRCDAFFIVLGDQPMVRPETFRALAGAQLETRARIIVPAHENRRGHPILLDAIGIDEILSLSPNDTLKTYTSAHARDILPVPVNDPAILEDIDTADDYQRARARWQSDARTAGD